MPERENLKTKHPSGPTLSNNPTETITCYSPPPTTHDTPQIQDHHTNKTTAYEWEKTCKLTNNMQNTTTDKRKIATPQRNGQEPEENVHARTKRAISIHTHHEELPECHNATHITPPNTFGPVQLVTGKKWKYATSENEKNYTR